jgi:hypothetical protein
MEGSSSRLMAGRAVYQALWSADVPPKVQMFAWKLATMV